MILTEEQARQCWCPFARAVAPIVDQHAQQTGGTTANRSSEGRPDADCRCLASGCMAWRVFSQPNGEQPARGFCGLAGAPYL